MGDPRVGWDKLGGNAIMITVTYGKGFQIADPERVKVKFREKIMIVQDGLQQLIDSGAVQSTLEDCTLKHYFTPKDETYGCCAYAREMLIPKGTLIIGKIHRHQHLNFISKGKVTVFTEFGQKHLEGPCTFVSEVGLKRAVYAEEDTLWTTVHLTQFESESELDKIEQEVISPSYDEMGLIACVDALPKLAAQGEKL
jgi:hypothetical protein